MKQLREIIDREKSVSVTDPDVPNLNAAFHRVLADASGNRMLEALISSMHWVTHPLSYIETSPELGRESVIHHMRIASAVRDRDEEAAATAMEAHLDYLREHVAQGLEKAAEVPLSTKRTA